MKTSYNWASFLAFFQPNRRASALAMVASLLLGVVTPDLAHATGDDDEDRPRRERRERVRGSGVIDTAEARRRHEESINPRAVCQQAQDFMNVMQNRLGDMRSGADGTTGDKYKELIVQYNQELARFALFDGVNKVVENYRGVLSARVTAPPVTEDPTRRMRDMAAVGNVLALQNAVDAILNDGIRPQELSTRFPGGMVCPNQNVNEAAVECEAATKIPVLYRALDQRCQSFAATDALSERPVCRALGVLRGEGNEEAKRNVSDVLGAFYNSYLDAYQVNGATTTAPASVTAEQARADLVTLNEKLTSLGTTSLDVGGSSKRGMDILAVQTSEFDLYHRRVSALEGIYQRCMSTPAEFPGSPQVCATCFQSNASACLPATQPSSGPFAPDKMGTPIYAAMRTTGLKQSMQAQATQLTTDLRDNLDSSPLLRAAVSGFRTTTATGASSETLSLASAQVAEDQVKANYDERVAAIDAEIKAARDGGARSLAGNLSSMMGPSYYARLKDSLIRGRNQAILQNGMYNNQTNTQIQGQLLKQNDFNDDKLFQYEMLNNLLSLNSGEPEAARVTMDCLRTGPAADAAMMTSAALSALRTASGTALADKFQACIRELSDSVGAENGKCHKFNVKKKESQARLDEIRGKINAIQGRPAYRNQELLQQHLSAIAQTACSEEDNRMKRMSCNLSDGNPLEEMEFFIAHNGRIVSSISRGAGNATTNLLGLLRGLQYFCTQALGGTSASQPPLCSSGFPPNAPIPVVSRREEELVREHGRLLDEYYEDNDSRYGMSPSSEKRGTVLASGLMATAGTTLGGLGSLWVGSMAFDGQLAMMEQQAIQMKTFQAFANSSPFPAFPFGVGPASPPFVAGGGFLVPPGSVPAAGGYSAYFSVGP